ncbi:MAG: phosphatidate cytidylyltransferase [Polyangiaceae bacterium]|nr:phosphatidate cytidylyltransferase [Polyangiaceae bacterium]
MRLATAAVAIPLMLALLFAVPPWGFYLLVLAATLVGAVELFGMTHQGDRVAQAAHTATALAASLVVFRFGADARALLALAALTPLVAMLVSLARLGAVETAALRMTSGAFGPLYLLGLTLLSRLHAERGAEGPWYVLMTLAFAWGGDTGGYFAGRFLGKHKLYPAVSPKKTVEGAIGGLAGSVLAAVVICSTTLRSIPLWHGVALALVAGALGQLGDLGESLLKRSTGVKDSGQIVPGHGGILDRVDALLMAATVVYLYTRAAHGLSSAPCPRARATSTSRRSSRCCRTGTRW